MNIAELQKKLLAAARANTPRETVPYAFEKRIMARLQSLPPVDVWAYWGASLWRAAAPCVAIMLLLGAWTFYSAGASGSMDNHSADLESTVLAPLGSSGDVR